MTGFNKTLFFDTVRQDLYNGVLGQKQVDGLNIIMRTWRLKFGYGGDYRHLAYMLATTHHETAFTMQPITEYGSVKYLQSKPYYPYIGRGYVQLTWDYNYEKAGAACDEDLLNFPDLALEPDLATIIMFDGMEAGWFTGKKLSDYFNASVNNPVGARKIINGTDKDDEIAAYHEYFLKAIYSAIIP